MHSGEEELLDEGCQPLPSEVRDHLQRLYQVPPGSVADAKARFGVRPGAASARLVYDSAVGSVDLDQGAPTEARTLRFTTGPSEMEITIYPSDDQCTVVVRSTATLVKAYFEHHDVVVELAESQGGFVGHAALSGDLRVWVEAVRPASRVRTGWIRLRPTPVIDPGRQLTPTSVTTKPDD